MQIFIFLLSAVAFLLLIFSLHLLFTKNGNLYLNKMLSIPLLGRFVQVCAFLIITASYQEALPVFQKLCIPFFFAAPVCTFLYVRGFIRGDFHLKKWEFIHFIPAALAIIHIMPFPMEKINWNAVAFQIINKGQLSITEKTGVFPPKFFNTAQIIILGGYLLATWYFAIKSGFLKKTAWNINKTWIVFYLSTSTFFKLLSFVALGFSYMKISYASSDIFLVISCIILILMMVFVIYHPKILYGYIILSPQKNFVNQDAQLNINYKLSKLDLKANISLTSENYTKTPSKNKLSSDQLDQFALYLQQHMEKEKPFLIPEFQMKDLTTAVDIPIHHCSFVINTVMNKNFRDWINSYRIQHFISEYPSLSNQMTIEAVALNSGFKNMTTFYNAFKKEIGQMPSTYFLEK